MYCTDVDVGLTTFHPSTHHLHSSSTTTNYIWYSEEDHGAFNTTPIPDDADARGHLHTTVSLVPDSPHDDVTVLLFPKTHTFSITMMASGNFILSTLHPVLGPSSGV